MVLSLKKTTTKNRMRPSKHFNLLVMFSVFSAAEIKWPSHRIRNFKMDFFVLISLWFWIVKTRLKMLATDVKNAENRIRISLLTNYKKEMINSPATWTEALQRSVTSHLYEFHNKIDRIWDLRICFISKVTWLCLVCQWLLCSRDFSLHEKMDVWRESVWNVWIVCVSHWMPESWHCVIQKFYYLICPLYWLFEHFKIWYTN